MKCLKIEYYLGTLRQQMQQRQAQEILEACTAPVFKSQPNDTTAREGGFAHFEARLEPVGDPTLKIEWLKDGRPMEASECIYNYMRTFSGIST